MKYVNRIKSGIWIEATAVNADDATCILLTQDEYSNLQCTLDDVRKRLMKKEREKEYYESRLAEAEEWMENKSQYDERLVEQQEYLEEALSELRQALREEQQLNNNLLRICKEYGLL